ncbi:MAG: hypothetical protein ACYCW6_04630 [Candidatus Xenobia bacterium]
MERARSIIYAVVHRHEGDELKCSLVALGPRGLMQWRFEAPQGSLVQEFHVGRHALWVRLGTTTVVALDENGQSLGWYAAPHIGSLKPAPDGDAYLHQGNRVVKAAPDGVLTWHRPLPWRGDEFFHVVAPNGTQLFVNEARTVFHAMLPDGSAVSPALPPVGTGPAQAGSCLAYGGARGHLCLVDLEKLTAIATLPLGPLRTPLVGRDGNFYVLQRHDPVLHAVSPDGTPLWSREVADCRPSDLDEVFRVGEDGRVYYVTADEEHIQQLDGPRMPVGGIIRGFTVRDGHLYVRRDDGHLVSLAGEVELALAHPSQWQHTRLAPFVAFDTPLMADDGWLALGTRPSEGELPA